MDNSQFFLLTRIDLTVLVGTTAVAAFLFGRAYESFYQMRQNALAVNQLCNAVKEMDDRIEQFVQLPSGAAESSAHRCTQAPAGSPTASAPAGAIPSPRGQNTEAVRNVRT